MTSYTRNWSKFMVSLVTLRPAFYLGKSIAECAFPVQRAIKRYCFRCGNILPSEVARGVAAMGGFRGSVQRYARGVARAEQRPVSAAQSLPIRG